MTDGNDYVEVTGEFKGTSPSGLAMFINFGGEKDVSVPISQTTDVGRKIKDFAITFQVKRWLAIKEGLIDG